MTENVNNNQWFHDILNRGLETFSEYWEIPRIMNTWQIEKTCRNGDIWVKQDFECLQRSQAADVSGLTTFMLLRAYLHQLLHSTEYSAYDLMMNWEKHKAEFQRLSEMRADLETPDALEILKEFERSVAAMGAHYKVEKQESLEKVITDPIEFGFLRFSAFESIERKLKPYQFLQGDGATEPLKVHSKIYEFWNINSLINAAARQLFDGVALCLVRDPKHFFASFFCIAVKAGETLTVLTDRNKGAHPKYNEMSRRPDRELSRRADENWFPYQLLDVEVSEDGKRLYEKERVGLVAYNQQLIPLADIGSLFPRQVIWLGILLDLIANRFGGKEPLQLPALSYTGEMIRRPDALVPPNSALVVAGKYKPLELPVITADDLTAERIAKNFQKPSYGTNRHVFERFKNQVPPEIFNIIGDKELKLLRESNSTIGEMKEKHWVCSEPESKIELHTFNPLDFGTPDELDKDRRWAARYNQISYIDYLAKKEFDEKRETICKWFDKKVRANRDNLLNYVAAMECNVELDLWKSSFEYRVHHQKRTGQKSLMDATPFPSKDEIGATSIVNILTVKNISVSNGIGYESRAENGGVRFGRFESKYRQGSKYICFSDDVSTASIGAIFEPETAAHLAILAGVEIDELPEQIRFWTLKEPYTGNYLLDRLDPEDWKMKDYFRSLKFHVVFIISKTYLNNLRKEHGFPRFDWSTL